MHHVGLTMQLDNDTKSTTKAVQAEEVVEPGPRAARKPGRGEHSGWFSHEQSQQHNQDQDRPTTMSPPTAALSAGNGSNTTWASSTQAEGTAIVAGDDVPPELDALRPTFASPSKRRQHQHQQQAAQIPSRRRLPISLAPVGVRNANSSPLPSLSSRMSDAAKVQAGALPGGSDGKASWRTPQNTVKEWHQQQPRLHSREYTEFARPINQLPGSPAAGGEAAVTPSTEVASPARAAPTDVGLRSKIDIAASPSSRAASAAGGGGGDGGSSHGIRTGAPVSPATAAASVAPNFARSSRAEGGSYHRSRKAYIQNRSISSGGDTSASPRAATAIAAAGIVEEGAPRPVVSRHARRFSSGGEFYNGTSRGTSAGGLDRYGGDLANDSNRRSSVGSTTGPTRVQIRDGGIAITSLLSSENNNGNVAGSGEGFMVRSGGHDGANTATAATPGSSSSTPSSAFYSYQKQESTASSVGGGDFTYTSLGGGAPSSRASTPGGGEGGRPPLVRKRSLTVAMDADPGGPAICPSPRGRRRSVDGVFDTKDSNPDNGSGTTTRPVESPSRPPRIMAVGGHNSVAVVGVGGGGGGCSPLVSYPSPNGDRARGREYMQRSPAHDRLSVTVSRPAMTGSSGGGSNCNIDNANTAETAARPASSSPVSHAGRGRETASASGGTNSEPMQVEWIPNDNAHAGGMLPTPSPVTSVTSASSALPHPLANVPALGRPPSPYPPSPGREYRRAGGVAPQRGTPHSPSPRRAPPSPAQAPGSAGLRRRGTRRLSGGRSTPRGVRSRSGVSKGVRVGGGGDSLGTGIGGGGAGGVGSGGVSGTYESDYDSDLSETSAYSNYSAMGSLERQLQQDTFFELDESLWRVVTRREICKAEQCVYRNTQTLVSHRKHYHATCSHIHQEGVKKGMRFHHHQLEKVKKHQRSHCTNQTRAPRDQGTASSPSMAVVRARSLDAQSSREGISSGGEDDEEEPSWSSREVELLEALVRNFGSGQWDQVSLHFNNRSPTQCARRWALGGTRGYPAAPPSEPSRHNISGSCGGAATTVATFVPNSGGGGGGAGAVSPASGASYRWGAPVSEHQLQRQHIQHDRRVSSSMAPAEGTALGTAAAATGGARPEAPGTVARGVLQQAGYPSLARSSSPLMLQRKVSSSSGGGLTPGGGGGTSSGVVPFGSPGGAGGGSAGRGPKGVGSWTKDEDDRLNALVGVFGVKWSQISDHMPGRVGKQCRERYLNHLDPSLRHGPWTDEEERLLLSLHARLNNQWAEIARQIPGRSDNDVKNRWNLICRRERAAEKNLQRSGSSGSATSTPLAPLSVSGGAPPRHGRTLSSGTAETAAAAVLKLEGRPSSVEGRGYGGGDDGGGSGSVGDSIESRPLPPSRAVSSEEEQRSMMEAKEAAEAGAGLVKLSLTAASAARDALEHSNFDAAGGAGIGSSGGVSGGGGIERRPPTSPISPRTSRRETESQRSPRHHFEHIPVAMVSPRFSRTGQPGQQLQHNPAARALASPSASPPPGGASSPRYSGRHERMGSHHPLPPRSPTRRTPTPPDQGSLGGGGLGSGTFGGPPRSLRSTRSPHSPYSPRGSMGHHPQQPLSIPRSPASENFRNSGAAAAGGSSPRGCRRQQQRPPPQGVAVEDADARRAAVAARMASNGGVAAWAWGGRV